MSRIYSTMDPELGVAPAYPDGANTRVLVVEDNSDDQELLRRQLRKADVREQILFVKDGRKAIDILTKDLLKIRSKLCAVFLDLQLNGISGLEVLRAIRSEPCLRRLPVVILTGSSDPDDIDECRRLGITTYLAKPISLDILFAAMEKVFHPPPRPPLSQWN